LEEIDRHAALFSSRVGALLTICAAAGCGDPWSHAALAAVAAYIAMDTV
jgi:hypothetical protein